MALLQASVLNFLKAILLVICLRIQNANAANILGLFTCHSTSHLLVDMSVMQVLAERGHNITMVSTLPPKSESHANIRNIIIPPRAEKQKLIDDELTKITKTGIDFVSFTKNIFFGELWTVIELQADVLQDERFTALYEAPDTKFDLIVWEYCMNDFVLGVAAKFKCPNIVITTGVLVNYAAEMVGNPNTVLYESNFNMGLKAGQTMPSYWQRLQYIMPSLVMKPVFNIINSRMQTFYNKLFANEEPDFPTLTDMHKNVSLLFSNLHFTEHSVRPNVPAVIEIGGIQIPENRRQLPEDLENFINASAYGVIYFSLGSNVLSANVKPELLNVIFEAFSTLKQHVIWKWETPLHTPGNAPNVLYRKWLPQNDLLAHPKVKLFITHGGRGGLSEALYHGVPMLVLPLFGDQHANAYQIVNSDWGLMLSVDQFNAIDFKIAVLQIIGNPQYTANVKRFSQIYRDRPLSAKNTVSYWTEYVLRHHGAAHIQSPLLHMSTMEQIYLDLLLVVIVVIFLILTFAKVYVVIHVIKKLSIKWRDCIAKVKVD